MRLLLFAEEAPMPKFRLALFLLLTPLAHAQQTWFTVVAAESQATTVTFPAAATIRWCDAATGKTCSPAEAIAAQTTLTAYCPDVAACNADDATDGLSGTTKDIEVLEVVGAVAQSVVVNGAAVAVPAIPQPNYPAFMFVPGFGYHISVSNLPASTAGAPMQGQVSVWDGDILIVTFTCTFNTVAPIAVPAPAGTPQSLAAIFGCVALPVPNQ